MTYPMTYLNDVKSVPEVGDAVVEIVVASGRTELVFKSGKRIVCSVRDFEKNPMAFVG